MKVSKSFDGSYIVTGTVAPPAMHAYINNLKYICSYTSVLKYADQRVISVTIFLE